MARKKQIRTRSKRRIQAVLPQEGVFEESTEQLAQPPRGPSRRLRVLTVIIAVFLLGWIIKNGYIVAAIANGRPIFWWNVYTSVMDRFGKQTLERMISEELILAEAQRTGAFVTPEEITAKENEILAGFGGQVSLENLLEYQGITKKDFDQEIRLQLLAQKIVEKEISITDQEITEYIASNSATLTATDSASQRQEAQTALLSEKVNERIQPWFVELREKAQITKLLQ